MNKSLIIILVFALFCCGCSTAGVAYRHGDWYLQHKINGYTTFNSRQKETIRQEVSNYMLWHHKEALPEYIIFLQNLNGVAQYDGPLQVEESAQLRNHLHSLYIKTLMPAIPPTAKLLSDLDNMQIHGLDRTFAEDIQRQKEELLDGNHDEALDRRASKTIDFLEWLAGNLSSEQEHRVREMSRRLPFVSHIIIQHREANQGRLIALLNGHADQERIAEFLSSWVLTPDATRTPQQQRIIHSFEIASDEMVAQIHGLLTEQQKEHMNKMIKSYIEDMRSLTTDMIASSATSR